MWGKGISGLSPFSFLLCHRKEEQQEKEIKIHPPEWKLLSSSSFSEKKCKVSQSQFLHKIKYFYHLFLQEKTSQLHHHPHTAGEERHTGITLLPLSEHGPGVELVIECKTPQAHFTTYRVILSLLLILTVITFHWSQILLISPMKKASNTSTYTALTYLLLEKPLQWENNSSSS